MSLYRKTRVVLEMIKFEHSIFALPFALTAALLAARGMELTGAAILAKLAWIVLAMVAARSAAMAFNRVVDAGYDARNPRTRARAIPAGYVTKKFTWVFILFWTLVFLFAAAQLNVLCLLLAPFALAVVFGYSYTKRFTALSHLILGVALGLAPAAAWIAVRGTIDWRIWILSAAVMLWVAGFDIIYACQDLDFDRSTGLFSIPAKLGVGPALWLARALHGGMLLLLIWLCGLFELGGLAVTGVFAAGALLAWEHSLVSARDLSRVNAAFFTVNGVVSVLFCGFWIVDILWFPR